MRTISTIADITFYGRDQVGNDVSATGIDQRELLGLGRSDADSSGAGDVAPGDEKSGGHIHGFDFSLHRCRCSRAVRRRVHDQENRTAGPSGPSELGTSLAIAATPDLLPQDGASTSQIVISRLRRERAAGAEPVAARRDLRRRRRHRLRPSVGQGLVDRQRRPRRRRLHRARSTVDNVDRNTRVQIAGHAGQRQLQRHLARFAEIRLVPTGVVGGETSVPNFTFSPAAPKQLETGDRSTPRTATLDQDADEVSNGTSATAARRQGRVASHQFREIDSYTVTLTVTDIAGLKGSRSKSVTVGTSGAAGRQLRVLADRARHRRGDRVQRLGLHGRRAAVIVNYAWQFGNGSTGVGHGRARRLRHAGHLHRLADSHRRRRQHGHRVAGSDGRHLQPRRADGGVYVLADRAAARRTSSTSMRRRSTSADPIVNYKWDFGDGGTATPRQPTTTHTFTDPGTYVVTLDDHGFQGPDSHDDQERRGPRPRPSG